MSNFPTGVRMSKTNPFEKVYHYGKHVNGNGDVSALCFKKPRAIDLRKALWTIRPAAVTCRRCLAALKPPVPSA